MCRIIQQALPLIAFLFWFQISAAQPGETVKKMFTEKTMPNMIVKDMDGNPVNIADLSKDGKIIVLNFWATWCAPCKKELNNIMDHYEDWVKAYNVEIVAISIDDSRNAAKVKSYVNGQNWDYRVLLDSNQDLKRALNFQTIPFTVLADRSGKIVYEHTGYVEGDEYILEEKIAAVAKKQ